MMSGRNPYDISKECEGGLENTLCYPITRHIKNYLDLPSIRIALGVDKGVGKFESCSDSVGLAFSATMDIAQPTQFWVAELLERGVKALIYVGTYDWICNWVGNEAFTLAMEWSGQDAFTSSPLLDWHVDGHTAGKVRTAGPLTFLTIYGAGHMVCYSNPRSSSPDIDKM